jgi:hypothetical protein
VARGGIVITYDSLTPGLRTAPGRIMRGVNAAVARQAPIAEGWAKNNAPWTDRTGNARSSLRAEPELGPNVKAIDIAHGVPYGIWLEIANAGSYEIIVPTIENQGPQLMALMNRLLDRTLG